MPVKAKSQRVKRVRESKVVAKPVAEKKVATPRATALSVPVYSLTGRAAGSLTLPKEIFGSKVNNNLLSQAVRVYSTNQKQLLAHTKTRGKVKASKAKIYRQKGTGRARHGAISAPIFVGGGIAFGPQSRKVKLDFPKGMKKAALISALSSKMSDKGVLGLSGIEKASGKTSEIAKLLQKIAVKSALIVTGQSLDNVVRGSRNIPGVSVLPANLINAYEVLKHDMLLVTKDAVEVLAKPKEGEESSGFFEK